ncbi:SET and MYND domain-containing protein 4-like isoform X3 [Diachasmimorpha longicaudata]|uniref:SET and MYND domain-containing protein 4-like isoform X3 n=1 Tax=Diachasmimorpha longicaudata TaxID=58733 RepID=UPI0030B91642
MSRGNCQSFEKCLGRNPTVSRRNNPQTIKMDLARELICMMKSKCKSHVGYGLQAECEGLVGHILENMAKSQMPVLRIDKKSDETSMKYREEGNEYFVAGDDVKAIETYTKSLAYAKTNEQMAYAHANRSAALYRKKMYKECIMDVKEALELDYPEEKRKRLEERGLKAMAELAKLLNIKSDEADEDIENCPFTQLGSSQKRKFPLISEGEADGVSKKSQEIQLPKAIVELSDPNSSGTFVKPRYLQHSEYMSFPYGPSAEAPANSDGIQISFSQKYGRHLIATKEFKPGDILTMERPFSWVIYRDKFYTHCHHCLERCYALLPCPECPISQYCSDICRTKDWDWAHKIECPVLSGLVNLLNVDEDKVRMVMKIIRMLMPATLNGKKIEELRRDMKNAEMNSDDRTAGFTDSTILDSSSPRSALSLATNMMTRPIIGISAFACVSALAAMLLATQTEFFGRKHKWNELRDINKFPDIKFCGSLMLRACVITSSNCFSIQPEPGIKSGSGLYVTHSLYNHSCAPNTFRHFEGLTMITRAMEPIHAGDQIFTGYGADYSYMELAKRKEKLMEEYFFDCQCPACINDWPTYDEILKNHVGSITKNKNLVQRLKPYKQRLLANKYDIEAVREVLCILHGDVNMPCEEILHGVQYLRSFYLGKLDKSR